MVDKNKLSDAIIHEIEKTKDDNKISVLIKRMFTDYNIPIDISSSIFTLKTEPIDYSDFIIYAVAFLLKLNVNNYFSENEIKKYSKHRLDDVKINSKLEFKVIKVSDDQYIGKISVADIIKLRDKQLINYNVNTQRTMQRISNGEQEYYKIFVNRKAIQKIMESYNTNKFIPNTITLNINGSNYRYYDDDATLVINKYDKFDIIDGYHRYLSMSNIYNLDSTFDYPMELRLVDFPEDKAQQFIFQEDQKTKMKKIDSNSLNKYSSGNRIVETINRDTNSLLCGSIGRNNIISSAQMATYIENLFFNKKFNKAEVMKTEEFLKTDIRDKFNEIIRYNFEILGNNGKKRMNYEDLMIILILIKNYDINMILEKYLKVMSNKDKISKDLYSSESKIRVAFINAVLEIAG